MGKGGRTRKSGKRYPSGKLVLPRANFVLNEFAQAHQPQGVQMGKLDNLTRLAIKLAEKDELPPRTELEFVSKILRERAANEAATEALINPFREARGEYVGEGNRTKRNQGGTPIARWKARGLLSEHQCLAIDYCLRLWERAGRQKLTTNPLETVGGTPSSGWAQQEALDELKKFKGDIPQDHWSIFENVCRFDMPTGVAGSELACDRKTVNVHTRAIVCFVADMIAKWKGFS